VQLRISPDSQLPPLADRLADDLVTVVGNLVDNALDAIGPGGWVEVSVQAIDGQVRVTVRDSGPGVAPELTEEIFRQGYTTKGAGGGHQGLGLALTRLICVHRGGSIDVQGSAFNAWVPLPEGAST
jgi:sensor histidine kinase regulating citrate/malate metabolism